MEFAFIAGAGLLVAAFAHEAIARTLSDPLQHITGRLAGRIG